MHSTSTSAGFTIPDPPSQADLEQCVHCGLCLPHCPTFRELHVETESPRGRLHLMRALGEGRVEATDRFVRHMTLCLDCRACEAACPSGVKFGHLMEATRAEIVARRPGSPRERLLRRLVFEELMPRPERLALFAGALRLYQRLGVQRAVRATGLLRRLPGRLAEAEALLPRISGRFFAPRGVVRPRGPIRRRVAFFAGCVMRVAFADTNRATVRLLARAGCEVRMPEAQVCCGALHAHAGEREGAKELARTNIAAFERAGAEQVVVNAAGCGAMLKEYRDLLAHDPAWAERARAFSARVRDLSEALAEEPATSETRAATPGTTADAATARGATGEGATGEGARGGAGPLPTRVVYQDACHLAHAQRIRRQPRDLLAAVPGVSLVEMKDADTCCGSAGIYNLTEPEMAERLGEQKAANVDATGAEVVVSANPGCLIQLRAELGKRGSRVRAVHLADFLDWASRRARGAGGAGARP
jgi:glycolate oxidase iron-sulfur subunit